MMIQQQNSHLDGSSMDDSSAASSPHLGSSFMLGQGLVQARISPANANATNTSGANASSRKSRRFFDSLHSTTKANQATETPKPNDNDNRSTSRDLVLDGVNVTQLRTLASSCLGAGFNNAASPAMAVFYASIVHAKTLSPKDAFLYAQTLLANQQAKRCVKLLEQSNLFRVEDDVHLKLESVLLAGQALASLAEWQSVLTLLEDSNHYTLSHCHHSSNQNQNNNINTSFATMAPPLLEDEDDIAWQSLSQSIPKTSRMSIHPLARVCCLRGQAYAETGHPLRAAVFWKRALQLDPLCAQALDLLLEKSVVAPTQVLDVLLGLEFSNGDEWLRAMYLARVHVAAPTTSSGSNSEDDNDNDDDDEINAHPSEIAADTKTDDPFWQDASSIQMMTPSFQQQPPPNNRASTTLSADKLFFGESTSSATKNNQRRKEQYSREVETALDTLWNTHKLHKSSEVLAMAAQRAYRQYDLKHALQYCQALEQVDPLCPTAGLVYVSTLVALGHKRQLFSLAHEWVDAAPKSAKAWFAVGAYYYTCQRYHVAQRHFCRATRLDPHCSDAWIAFGTSFAACDESDQALASFRAAQRLAPGDHTSLLYIGMEYLRTNHLTLAQHFLQAAHQSSNGTDPLCRNELGVLCMAQKKHKAAIRWFLKALGGKHTTTATTITTTIGEQQQHDEDEEVDHDHDHDDDLMSLLETCQDVYWEGTLFNLGQAYRKTRQFAKAISCLERCLTLKESASAYANLAFCHHLMGDYDQAIDTYHQSLSKNPEDPFCSEMLHRCLTDALESSSTNNFLLGEENPTTVGGGGGGANSHSAANTPTMNTTPSSRRRRDPSTSLWTEDGFDENESSSHTSDVEMG
jgi:anaphase-promoting complex subunit 6